MKTLRRKTVNPDPIFLALPFAPLLLDDSRQIGDVASQQLLELEQEPRLFETILQTQLQELDATVLSPADDHKPPACILFIFPFSLILRTAAPDSFTGQ